jgi:hypothetical protein
MSITKQAMETTKKQCEIKRAVTSITLLNSNIDALETNSVLVSSFVLFIGDSKILGSACREIEMQAD